MRARLLLGVLFLLPIAAAASPADGDFLAAREAFQKGQAARLDDLAPSLKGHPLSAYVEYWQLRMRLASVPRADILGYLDRYAGELPGNRLRADWLRQLAQEKDWAEFRRQYARLSDPETDLQCLHLQARQAQGEAVAKDALPLWMTGRDLPGSCTPVFDALRDSGELAESQVWARLRLAFETGNGTLAKSLSRYLPQARRPDPAAIDSVVRNPQKYLETRGPHAKGQAQREVVLFALGRTAAATPSGAAETWRRIQQRFPEDERSYGWVLVATAASRKLQPEALAWFREARDAPMTDVQLAWKARAALRAKDWNTLLATCDAMGPEERNSPAWRYWRARALAALGRQFEANAVLVTLASELNFHGQLAAEDLGPALSAPAPNHVPSDAEVDAVRRLPGIQRALAFYRLGLRYEGNLEWIWAIRGMDDSRLMAAAELARREGWYERAIATADRSRTLFNLELRYPAPYPELIRAAAREMDLDEAWVYGLIRQESRFVATARSSAGASGLMQVMPATAQWIAKRLGIKEWQPAVKDAPDANVSFGTFYLKEMLTRLDGSPVLASAAYNAGPRRAQEWRADAPLESAVYIDTIPFSETRDYVRKVMSNATQYARLFGHNATTLKARLGVVPAKGGSIEGDVP
jgi:soluble lytic murein transglycosylase